MKYFHKMKYYYFGYNLGGAKIKVAKDGIVYYSKGLYIIYNLDREAEHCHVNDLAEELKNKGINPKIYNRFCKHVLPCYKDTWIPSSFKIDDYLDNYIESSFSEASKYIDADATLRHQVQPKQLVKKPKKNNKDQQ